MRAGGHGFPTRPLGAAAAGAALKGVQAGGMAWEAEAKVSSGCGRRARRA